MAMIKLQNASADFPVYNSSSRSIKKAVLDVATGGRIIGDEKRYNVVRAIDHISLCIQEGERVGLLGHNGAGKSTLLRIISKVYEPTTGYCDVIGSTSSLIDINLGLDSEATGRQNIIIRATVLGVPLKEILTHLDEIIDFSELGPFIDMPMRTYSSGMQMRLAFAVSTFFVADIVVMDEWISVGDKNFSHKAEKQLRMYVDKSKILVIASHSPDFLRSTCNRIIWLEHGQVKMDGPCDEIIEAYLA